MFFNEDLDFHFDVDQLLNEALEEILRHEHHQQFLRWVQKNIICFFDSPPLEESLSDQHLNALAILLGYAIWNATPLPGNNFIPNPMPRPKRNERCPCGSGKKFKQCCLHLDGIPSPDLQPEAIWPILIDKLSPTLLSQAIRSKKIPLSTLDILAQDYLDEGRPKKALALLDPYFSEKISCTDHESDLAFNTLLDAYDALNYTRKKKEAINRVIENSGKSPLRSGAWQRLAAIKIDAGDPEGAWEAFRHAQRDDPQNPAIGGLEINLLLAENKIEQAMERANFWRIRLKKHGVPEDDPAYLFFESIHNDPVSFTADLEMNMADGAGSGLKTWLSDVSARPVPTYELVLSESGMAEKPLQKQHQENPWQLSLPFSKPEKTVEPVDANSTDEVNDTVITPQRQITLIEKKWHRVFTLPKPFSIHFTPFDSIDPWEIATELKWSSFLHSHPEAFDSIDILDDLACALEMNPYLNSGWAYTALIEPILKRSRTIFEQTLAAQDGPVELSWLISENRPTLRNLARLVLFYDDRGMNEDAIELASFLVKVNPGDNHGFRTMVMNDILRKGTNREALDLADRYPDDMFPEIVLGRVLALFRLKDLTSAARELHKSMKYHKTSVQFLWRARVKKPDLHEYGVSLGGEDQAWLYREEMRDVWKAEPGALDWLKKEAKKHG